MEVPYYLWEARQQGKPIKWAKQQFEQQLTKAKSPSNGQQWQLWLRWLVWDFPVRLGKIPQFIGVTVGDIGNWITGLVMLLLPVLVLVGVVRWNEVWDFVRDKLGIK